MTALGNFIRCAPNFPVSKALCKKEIIARFRIVGDHVYRQIIVTTIGEFGVDSTQIFLRGIWKIIPDDVNTDWVEDIANSEGDNGPSGDYGPIVKEMLDKGISENTIARFAKIVGYGTAFSLCYHLGDPNASYENFPEEEKRIAWRLETIDDESGEPLAEEDQITCPYEQMLMMDPSGREMCPPK